MFVGFLFKVTAAPFHKWAPDVYDGAPLAIIVFISTVPLSENPPNPFVSLRLERSVSVDSPRFLFLKGLMGLLSMSL